MMSIDPHHPLIIDTINTVLSTDIDLTDFHMNIADYDGDLFMFHGLSESMLGVTLLGETVQSIGEAGGFQAIQEHLTGFPSDSSHPGSFTIIIDKSQIPAEATADIASKFSLFRTVFVSGPFALALRSVAQGVAFQPKEVVLRPSEKLWIIPGDNRVTFVFQIFYKDSNDSSLAKIFLQEFQDSKKQISNAPVISFGAVPPESVSSFKPKREGLFLSVTMLRDQISNPNEQAKWLSSLKQYLTYHMHSCKTYLHMRMRKKTDLLLGVLKQAVPEKLQEKTFKRARAAKGIKEEAKIINNFRG